MRNWVGERGSGFSLRGYHHHEATYIIIVIIISWIIPVLLKSIPAGVLLSERAYNSILCGTNQSTHTAHCIEDVCIGLDSLNKSEGWADQTLQSKALLRHSYWKNALPIFAETTIHGPRFIYNCLSMSGIVWFRYADRICPENVEDIVTLSLQALWRDLFITTNER